jgi:hypothetical protein
MIIYYEVNAPTKDVSETGEPVTDKVAVYDVTGMDEDGRQDVLADLMLIYGDAEYVKHTCGHDDGTSCVMEKLP